MRPFAIATAILLASVSVFATDVPAQTGFVTDEAGILPADKREQLAAKLESFHKDHGGDIVILIVQSLKGEDVETFSINVAKQWKVGKAGENNGLIFLVAIQDRKNRIELGEGLQGKITDGRAGEIADAARPFFKAKDFYGGIDQVVSLCIADLTGLQPSPGVVAPKADEDHAGLWVLIGVVVLIIIVLCLVRNGDGDSIGLALLAAVADSTSSSDDDDDSSSSSSSKGSSDSGGSFDGGGASSGW